MSTSPGSLTTAPPLRYSGAIGGVDDSRAPGSLTTAPPLRSRTQKCQHRFDGPLRVVLRLPLHCGKVLLDALSYNAVLRVVLRLPLHCGRRVFGRALAS